MANSPRVTRNEAPRRIALITHQYPGLATRIMAGVGQFARQNRRWRILVTNNGNRDLAGWLQQIRPDGIIAHCGGIHIARTCLDTGVPVVNTSNNTGPDTDPAVPSVQTDNQRIGGLAADHLLELGITRFAYAAIDARFAEQRREGFVERLRARGHDADLPRFNLSGDPARWEADRPDLHAWLENLERPIGLFCSHDDAAMTTIEACELVGIRIPDEMAVIGVDNDPVLTDCAVPALTSIDTDLRHIGFRAAELLDQLIHGEPAPNEPLLIAPHGVVARDSTSLTTCADDDLARALQFIRQRYTDSIDVEDVVDQVEISRRSLERRFKSQLGRSPRDEIRRLRIDRVKQLLVETELPLSEIATQCGFIYLSHLSLTFKKALGITPSDYRRQYRLVGNMPNAVESATNL